MSVQWVPPKLRKLYAAVDEMEARQKLRPLASGVNVMQKPLNGAALREQPAPRPREVGPVMDPTLQTTEAEVEAVERVLADTFDPGRHASGYWRSLAEGCVEAAKDARFRVFAEDVRRELDRPFPSKLSLVADRIDPPTTRMRTYDGSVPLRDQFGVSPVREHTCSTDPFKVPREIDTGCARCVAFDRALGETRN